MVKLQAGGKRVDVLMIWTIVIKTVGYLSRYYSRLSLCLRDPYLITRTIRCVQSVFVNLWHLRKTFAMFRAEEFCAL